MYAILYDMGENVSLTRSTDQKVTNAVAVSKNTGKARPVIANAFGLPSGHGYSCPEATAFCSEICYAGRLERARKNVLAVLVKNWDLLRDASRDDMVRLLSDMIGEFSAECDKRGAQKLFRIHWDGDFFSPVYAVAWATVIKAHPDVQFWAYTRVASAALYLHALKLANLSLYFSADRDNMTAVPVLQARGLRIAFVGPTFADGKVALPNATRCPENNGALPLIDATGSACVRCGLCVHGRKDVLFSATKK